MVPQLLFTINVLRPTKVGVIQLAARPCRYTAILQTGICHRFLTQESWARCFIDQISGEVLVQESWLNKAVQTDREWSTHFHKEWAWPRIILIHGCPAHTSCLGFASPEWDAPELQWNPCGPYLPKHQSCSQMTLINTFLLEIRDNGVLHTLVLQELSSGFSEMGLAWQRYSTKYPHCKPSVSLESCKKSRELLGCKSGKKAKFPKVNFLSFPLVLSILPGEGPMEGQNKWTWETTAFGSMIEV